MPDDLTELVQFLMKYHPFRKMGEEQVMSFVRHVEHIHVPQGNILYRQGDEAYHLYIVFSGQIEFNSNDIEQEEFWGVSTIGNLFGFEVWHDDVARLENAVAVSGSEVLRIDWQSLLQIAETNNILAGFLDMMFESQRLAHELPLEWRSDDETVVFITRPHQFFFWLKIIPSILLLGFIVLPLIIFDVVTWTFPLWSLIASGLVAVAAILWAAWFYVDWTNDFYVITDRRIIRLEKVAFFYDSHIESPLDAVLSVSSSTSYWGRLLHFGKIIVRTYTGNIEWNRVGNIPQIISMLEEMITRSNDRKIHIEKKEKIDTIRESLGYVTSENGSEQVSQLSVSEEEITFSQWFASLFSLKTVNSTTVTYRTHWFLLLKRTWLPAFFAVGWLAFLTARLSGYMLQLSWQMTSVVLAAWFIVLGTIWIYEFIDWRNDQYILTEDQIIDTTRKPLGSEEKRSAPISNILSIEYKRLGLIGLLLNFGTVYIHIGEEEFSFDHVSKPAEVQQEITFRINRLKQKEKKTAAEQEKQQMMEWLKAYHQAVSNGDRGDDISLQ